MASGEDIGMPAIVDASWCYQGLRALVMENELLRLVVLPEVGGRIWSLTYKPLARELLWHHPRLKLLRLPFGVSYDNHFFGGWDEIFPNDAPVTISGEELPDHGEFWSIPFDWWIASKGRIGDEVSVCLVAEGPLTACLLEKTITLRSDEFGFTIGYRLHNPTGKDLPFLWKLHPAFAVEPGARILLPPCQIRPEFEYCSRFSTEVTEFPWSHTRTPDGQVLDVSLVPPPSDQSMDFYYALNLDRGECGVFLPSLGLQVRLSFPLTIFSTVWVFASYGGWRHLYVCLLEPSTGYPYRLEEGIRNGTVPVLKAGGEVRADVRVEVTQAGNEGGGAGSPR
ncbi:MAG: DUF5107 domain-containing protein [Armatimonadetes bacterium]|nr:DUF5107 domain-containing protein [Armatimonadota bacterium]MDW8123050.1 DUF5107 domain-containing protein [Armatimonadota bacterium]